MDLPINFSIGALKSRYLFKLRSALNPQKTQLRVQGPGGDFGASWPGLGIGRKEPMVSKAADPSGAGTLFTVCEVPS